MRQAKARLEQAEVSLNRSRELRDQGILSQAEYDATDAAFKVAQSLYNDSLEEVNNRRGILAERRSDLALAEQQLTDTQLRAPFSGAVQQRRANLGEYLAAGAPVLTLVKLSPLRLRLDVPEREALNSERGSRWRCAPRAPRRLAGPDRPALAGDRGGEPLADRRGGGRQPERPAVAGLLRPRRDPDRRL